MKTQRLYWTLPHDRTFVASVLRVMDVSGHLAVVLDRTLFHPEGGGQAADRGYLVFVPKDLPLEQGPREIAVTDVVEDGPAIIHMLDASPDALPVAPGWEVRGIIDWDYRLDLTEQHTGQHILSRAFEEIAGANTVGFHLGEDYVSIDLDIQALSLEVAEKVEDRANEVVRSGLSITAKEYPREELPAQIRTRLPIGADEVRVVFVGDFDACACGGTHLGSTCQLGLIKLNRVDRAHGGVRVVFKCGRRAMLDYREKEKILQAASSLLNVAGPAVPSAIEALLAKSREAEKGLEEARMAAFELMVDGRIASVVKSVEPVVAEVFSDVSLDQMKLAARRIGEATGKPTVCLTLSPRFAAIVFSPSGVPDARKVVGKISERWGGRGGGNPGFAQLGSKEPLEVTQAEVVLGVVDAAMQALGEVR